MTLKKTHHNGSFIDQLKERETPVVAAQHYEGEPFLAYWLGRRKGCQRLVRCITAGSKEHPLGLWEVIDIPEDDLTSFVVMSPTPKGKKPCQKTKNCT
jgi:hypothetical protein